MKNTNLCRHFRLSSLFQGVIPVYFFAFCSFLALKKTSDEFTIFDTLHDILATEICFNHERVILAAILDFSFTLLITMISDCKFEFFTTRNM